MENAKVVFTNPDYAQQKIREYVLSDGKILVMTSPMLKHGYLVVHLKDVQDLESIASTIRGAFKYGKAMSAEEIPKPYLIVEGSVAVDPCGHRLGKGYGYGDAEICVLRQKFGSIPIVTTVHDIQVVETVPVTEKDEKISIIITPTKVIRASNYRCSLPI